MATLAHNASAQEKIEQLRELFADAPEVGKKALENVLGELTSQASPRRRRRWRAPAAPAAGWARSPS